MPEWTLQTLRQFMADNGARSLYAKRLSENDNSKQQVYLGGNFAALNVLPLGELTTSAGRAGPILRASIRMFWITEDAELELAPNTQVILYPQYPEVRLSGFLLGCRKAPNILMRPVPRTPGRVMFFGVRADRSVLAYVAAPGSAVAQGFDDLGALPQQGVLHSIPSVSGDTCQLLLAELCRIHHLGWIEGKRLRKDLTETPCNSQNCGGCTLEAELGIPSNSAPHPDYLGWEVKQYAASTFGNFNGSQRVTVMTPEPDGGLYRELKVAGFVERFGYSSGKTPDRLDFTGTYFAGQPVIKTGLTLSLLGYDALAGTFGDPDEDGVALLTPEGEVAALWSFKKLIHHWNEKHAQAVYVQSQCEKGPPFRYRYGEVVRLCRGADFGNVLRAISDGVVYLDPGMKVENVSTTRRGKARSQFRVGALNLPKLYSESAVVSACNTVCVPWSKS